MLSKKRLSFDSRRMVAHRYHPSFHVIALKICNLFLKKLKQNRKIIFCNKKNLFSLLLLFSPSVYYLLFHFFNFFFVLDFYPWPIVPIVIIIKMETRLLFPAKTSLYCDAHVFASPWPNCACPLAYIENVKEKGMGFL